MEVTIPDQGPPSAGGEVGSQAPQKHHTQTAWERTEARHKSIERAFERSKASQAAKAEGKPEPKAPPRVRADTKSEQPAPQRPAPSRGTNGRFESSAQSASVPEAGDRPAGQRPSQYAPLADNAPYRQAPQRFDRAAQADWHGAPESVRAATHRAIQQYEHGIRQYQAAANEFQQVRGYYDMARQSGQNLKTVLDNYYAMEKRLHGNVFGGVDLIINNLGLKKQDGSPYRLQDFAVDVLRHSPEQHRLIEHQNAQQAQQHQMRAMHQEMQHLATGLQQMHYQQRFTATRSQVDKFADSHPGFDERSDIIRAELAHGYSLEVAYNRAMRLRPGNARSGNTHAAQTRNAPAQTRDMDRSISGSPNGSSHPSQRPKKSSSNREALQNAFRRVRSGA